MGAGSDGGRREPVRDDPGRRAGPVVGAGRAAGRHGRHLRRRVPLAARFAHVLEELGVGPGDRVAVQTRSRGPRWCSISAACAPAPSTCRSTPPTRRPRSTTSSATPNRACSSAARTGDLARSCAAWPGCARWRRWARRAGPLARRGGRGSRPMRRRRTCGRRPRRDPLHLGHDRALEGRDAQPRQPRLQRRWRCIECWGFTADDVLLHALPIFHVHGLFVATQLRAAHRRVDDLAAQLRRRPGAAPACRARP